MCYFAGTITEGLKPPTFEVSATIGDMDTHYELIGPFSDKQSEHPVHSVSAVEDYELAIISPVAESKATSTFGEQSHGIRCKVCHEEHTYLTVISGDESGGNEDMKCSQSSSATDMCQHKSII